MIGSSDLPVGDLESDLCTKHKHHRQQADGQTNCKLPLVGCLRGHFELVLGVGVDGDLALEIVVLSRRILEIPHEPLIADVLLLSLPGLVEERDPDHDHDGVDDTQRTRREVIVLDAVLRGLDNHNNTKDDTDDGHRDQPACVMNQPGEVEAELLTVVVFDEVQGLHVAEEACQEHTTTQTPLVLLPGDTDEVALRHVDREVIRDDMALYQVVKVKLCLKSLTDNRLMLSGIELVIHVCCVTLEWHHAVVLGEAAFDL